MTTQTTQAKETRKQRIARKLFNEQNGLCWICGHKMMFPNYHPKKSPNRWMTTVDHIGHKNGKPRPRKAAHAGCNHIRHHYPIDHAAVVRYVEEVHVKFMNPSWVKGVFGNV